MTPAALDTHIAFVRLAAEAASSLYVEQLLHDGYASLPLRFRRKFPSLACWDGIAALKARLARCVSPGGNLRVLLAGRSIQLMNLAARTLFRRCHRVLATDLSWPPYQRALNQEASITKAAVVQVPVRSAILSGMSRLQFVALLAARFAEQDCDGLFLPAVDHLGIRVPIAASLRAIRKRGALRFAAVDGAQALGHVPLASCSAGADMLITGAHKWLGAYHPLGVAFSGRRETAELVGKICQEMIEASELDDPLLRFVHRLEHGSLDGHGETLNVSSLFSCQGALAARTAATSVQHDLRVQLANAQELAALAPKCGWAPRMPAAAFRSGILLLQSTSPTVQAMPAAALRSAFHAGSMAVSVYEHGLVRLSLPKTRWRPRELEVIQIALRTVHRNPSAKSSLDTTSTRHTPCVLR